MHRQLEEGYKIRPQSVTPVLHCRTVRYIIDLQMSLFSIWTTDLFFLCISVQERGTFVSYYKELLQHD